LIIIKSMLFDYEQHTFSMSEETWKPLIVFNKNITTLNDYSGTYKVSDFARIRNVKEEIVSKKSGRR